eukprot:CAMPEP_0118889788 /NCGR_PEP_ID=MMETSP1166-20130328/545_1 /TAXON_ID=1104430 /ORGANISM="Chrysoreinhardia sp, Strain CCMP3193" /LENGTH=881 /DNA_ID=CAMNT_0006828383 /DNA_START=263 /DNA_END=2908 /DNA_ORIENTATION=+
MSGITHIDGTQHTIEGFLRKKGSLFSWRTYFVSVDATRTLSWFSKASSSGRLVGTVRLGRRTKILFDPKKENGFVVVAEQGRAFKFAAETKRDAVLWKEVLDSAALDDDDDGLPEEDVATANEEHKESEEVQKRRSSQATTRRNHHHHHHRGHGGQSSRPAVAPSSYSTTQSQSTRAAQSNHRSAADAQAPVPRRRRSGSGGGSSSSKEAAAAAAASKEDYASAAEKDAKTTTTTTQGGARLEKKGSGYGSSSSAGAKRSSGAAAAASSSSSGAAAQHQGGGAAAPAEKKASNNATATANAKKGQSSTTTTTTAASSSSSGGSGGSGAFADFYYDATKYSLHKAIGKGSYGLVVSGVDMRNSTPCAIKKIGDAFADLVDAKRIVREIRLMHGLNHDNVLQIYDCYAKCLLAPGDEEDGDHGTKRRGAPLKFDDIYIVTELLQTDLHDVIYARRPLSRAHVQYFAYQMLRGLAYMHAKTVVHRDIKPGNILLNDQCQLKICDFGLARALPPPRDKAAVAVVVAASSNATQKGGRPDGAKRESTATDGKRTNSGAERPAATVAPAQSVARSHSAGRSSSPKLSAPGKSSQKPQQQPAAQLTEYVVTRWYRAPELLLSCRSSYDGAVDVWSAGCVVAEMVNRHPLFAGRDVIDQIKRVVSTIKAVRPRDLEKLAFVTNNKARAYVQSIDASDRYGHWGQVVPKLADGHHSSSGGGTSTSSGGGGAAGGARGGPPVQGNQPDDHPRVGPSSSSSSHSRGGAAKSPGVDFLAALLRFDPANRPTAEKALHHVFLGPMRAELAAGDGSDLVGGDNANSVDLADVERCPLEKAALRGLLERHDLRYTPPLTSQIGDAPNDDDKKKRASGKRKSRPDSTAADDDEPRTS